MSAADLDNVTEGVGLGFKGIMQFLQSREKGMGDFGNCRYVHHRWKAVEIWLSKIGEGRRKAHGRIVGGLGHVDMVIGVNWLLGAEFTAQYFNSTIGNDLEMRQCCIKDDSEPAVPISEISGSQLATDLVGIHVRLCS